MEREMSGTPAAGDVTEGFDAPPAGFP